MTRATSFRWMAQRALRAVVVISAMVASGQLAVAAWAAPGSSKRRVQGTSAALALKAADPDSSKLSTSSKSASVKKSGRKRHARSRREPTQKAPTSDRIREIQSALGREGYYQDEPNGKWDSHTVEAMEKFQQEHGLTATGKLDALSLQKLGLGSQIAGVSAPQPPIIAPPATDVPTTPATPKSPEHQ